jgi:hypothetical protein
MHSFGKRGFVSIGSRRDEVLLSQMNVQDALYFINDLMISFASIGSGDDAL